VVEADGCEGSDGGPEGEGDQRRGTGSGRDALADSTDEEHEEEERQAAGEEANSPKPSADGLMDLRCWCVADNERGREREERHSRCLVRVEMAAVAGALLRRANAAVDRERTVAERVCQTEA